MDDDQPKPGWAGKRTDPELETKLRARARELRNQTTSAERILWFHLKGRQREGFKFRRQHVIDHFIVDFYCAEARLVIEVDGRVHTFTFEQDEDRQAYLESLGLRVLRISNDEVEQNLNGVIALIDQTLRALE